MAEAAILSNQREATRLYQRGVAAARSGHRRVAVGLLQRAVQLNPQHEGAWLWLSGVLDDPAEAAYCLRSVLELNPGNERARAGLTWLEQRQMAQAQAVVAPTLEPPAASTATQRLPTVDADEPTRERNARHHGESWWVNWRHSRRAMSRARVVMWLVPILLLGLTLAWRQSVELTVQRIQSNLRPTVVAPTLVPVVAEAGATAGALPPTRPRASDDAALLAYLSQIEPLREQLRAVEEYRQTIRQPGLSSITHAASARQLRAKVENAHTTMSAMQPPRLIADLHQEYVDGLSTELGALDDLLAFYGEYNVGLANRAALRFQESSARFNRVQAGFDQHLGRISRAANGPPPQAPR
jgi:tetratricopeptide (TPR) repeat protein